MTFSSTAPAHPHATREAVYPALFFPLILSFLNMSSSHYFCSFKDYASILREYATSDARIYITTWSANDHVPGLETDGDQIGHHEGDGNGAGNKTIPSIQQVLALR